MQFQEGKRERERLIEIIRMQSFIMVAKIIGIEQYKTSYDIDHFLFFLKYIKFLYDNQYKMEDYA